MKSRSLAQLGLAAALLGLAAFLLVRTFSGPRIDLDPYRALGTVAAEEAARLCGGRGHLVLVVPDTSQGNDPVLEAQVLAFRQALQRRGGVRLGSVETVVMDPFLSMQTGGAIPPEQFLALRQRHADAAALVLFIPFPPVVGPGFESPQPGVPRLMVVSAALPGYEALIQRGIIDLAILPRSSGETAPPTPEPADPLQAIFDREYLLLRSPAR
jgi:hypothetical protein